MCHTNGATLGCYVKGCLLKYHYLCARDAGLYSAAINKLLQQISCKLIEMHLQNCASYGADL